MSIDNTTKQFDTPDEVRLFAKGKFAIIQSAEMTTGSATYEPGWQWSEPVSPIAGADLCEVEPIGMVISGEATAAMTDGAVDKLTPGTVCHVPAAPTTVES